MAEQFGTILTSVGLAKLVNAQVTGTKLNLTQIAVGDGNGSYYDPSESATALKNEVWRGAVNSVDIDSNNPNWIVIEGLIPSSAGGFTVREVGVFDSVGDLIAIGKYPETFKPSPSSGASKDLLLGMIIEVTNAESVELQIDPNVVIATRKYVDEKDEDLQNQIDGVTSQLAEKVTVDDLPTTNIVSAHRGGGATGYPYSPIGTDCGFGGYDMAIRMGAHIIDVDYRTTADGVMIAMHDSTVDRTTNGTGLVSDHVSNALPKLKPSKYLGSGWADEEIPTIEEILVRYGGKVIITIEAKEGINSVTHLANLIKKYKLERSVFINTSDIEVAKEIVNQGCLAHVYGCDTVEKVISADNAGAWLIEVPYNASSEIVNTALSGSSIKRVIASPVWFKSQVRNMTPGIMGHVTDALGMTNRAFDNKPLVNSITPSIKANKFGIGWRMRGSWLVEDGKLINNGRNGLLNSEYQSLYFGDLSGDRGDSYSIFFTVKFSEAMIGMRSGIRLRVCCEIADGNGWDADTDGYVCNIRGTGQMNLWKSNGTFGSGILLGETVDGANPIDAESEYTVRIDISPSTISMTRIDTGEKIEAEDSTYRGNHIYLWSAGVDAEVIESAVTNITIV